LTAKGIYFVYRFLQAHAAPAVLFYFLIRCLRDPRYRKTMRERLGFLPFTAQDTRPGGIWLHAVSVGEVMAAVPLVRQLRARVPETPIVVSVSTLAGRAAADEKLGAIVDRIFYAPLDYAFVVRSVLRRVQPAVLVVLETEIWPNLFREARRFGCGVLMANGRISDRVTARYRRLRHFFRGVLSFADRILVQDEQMRDRFLAAGAIGGRVAVAGNLKYDFTPVEAPQDSPVRAWLQRTEGPLWIAASTTQDDRVAEEDAIIAAWRQLPGWRLIVAPRKPERFAAVAGKLRAAGVSFALRSTLNDDDAVPVLLLDTIGELNGLFAFADVVFMGGSLAERGGHNVLEPAFSAKPIVVGPHLENFREIASAFRHAKAFLEIGAPSELKEAVIAAANDPDMGERALRCARESTGAAVRIAQEIEEQLRTHFPCGYPKLPSRIFLSPLAALWRAGSRLRVRKDMAARRQLSTPVISVGNITAGGTGKTPVVLWLVSALRSAGLAPAILSRGYGRKSRHKALTLAPGTDVDVLQTGDEPQIFLRSGVAPVGIGGDRYEVGQLMEERFHPDVFVLDDGFQHRKLARNLDIVLVDALEPFGKCRVIPSGRLREPLPALARAHAFILTRTEHATGLDAIEYQLHNWNRAAPVFRSRTVARSWVVERTGDRDPIAALLHQPVVAFCALGNPAAFWNTLHDLGMHVAERFTFDDHHQYTPGELRRMLNCTLAQQARVIVTTQKDVMNLCLDCDSLLPGVELYWLEIGVEVDRAEELLKLCQGVIEDKA
jgi:3-deoxy-D-manno-octulosonic-acid transferase